MSRRAPRPALAHIRPDSPRAADWRKVFGSETVPIKSPLTLAQ